jgi:hypothetical protein
MDKMKFCAGQNGMATAGICMEMEWQQQVEVRKWNGNSW